MLSKDFQISSFLPPGLIVINGETFVCPGWHKVPNGTTLDEVYAHWKQDLPSGVTKKTDKIINAEVLSSDGKRTYKVAYDGMWWNCECSGFEFRKKCRHVDEIKKQHNLI